MQIEARLIDAVKELGSVVVAFSGGVDSALVAVAAHRALHREQVLLATADSTSLAQGELAQCENFAESWGIEWLAVSTDEMSDSRYRMNEGDRCFWCKTALMDQLEPVAAARSAEIALGVNLDDLGDHRPGQEAARERGARFPLVEAGFQKADIRALAKEWGISVWDRPAMPCLSSRVPYGTEISVALLSQVDRAEAKLRTLGFRDVRVRHYGDTARIEVPGDEVVHAAELAQEVDAAVRAVGYRYVTLDLAGLRSGNLNGALKR